MALLAGSLPVLYEPPTPFVDVFADTRMLGFRSLDGSVILPFTGAEFINMWGSQGLDLPPRIPILDHLPGMDGAVLSDVQIQERTATLPIWFGSDSGHLDYLARKDGLRSLFNHRLVDLRSDEGSFDLVANSGSGDEERTLRCLYVSGMDGNRTQDTSGSFWEICALSLLAVRAYWYGTPWSTPPISTPTGAHWFRDFPPQFSQSRAIGQNIPITVLGHVESWPRVDVRGPATSVQVTSPNGLNVSIPGPVAAGEWVTIISDPRGRTALFGGTGPGNGSKNWSRVGPFTKWRPLDPGPQTLSVVMAGATSGANASQVIISGDSRYEHPWAAG